MDICYIGRKTFWYLRSCFYDFHVHPRMNFDICNVYNKCNMGLQCICLWKYRGPEWLFWKWIFGKSCLNQCRCCQISLGALQISIPQKNELTPCNQRIKVICHYTHSTKTNSKPPKLQTSETARLQVRYMLHRKENILVPKKLFLGLPRTPKDEL